MGLLACGPGWCARDSSRFPAPSASIKCCAGRGLRAPDQSPPGKNTSDAMKCPCRGIASRLTSSLFPIEFEALVFINTPPLMIVRATGWLKSTRRCATQIAKMVKVIQRMPFPIRCVQTDNDSTFTNWYTGAPKTAPHKPVKIHAFTRTCHEHDIEHILIKPGQPQLNGKVERSHQCDEEEFYRTFEARDFHELQQRFGQWLDFYNHHRPHSSLGYLTPVERLARRLKLDTENWIWSEPNPTSPSAEAQCLSRAAQGRLAQRARSWTLDKQTEQRLSRYAPLWSVTHV